ncbi:MAG: LysM peptidoglycan-binding domain-containing protein, partial [Caldilineaceae bacterium]|nr:LysM peptidoglycan-binding domain-containing protein [Caldilineaceae bacterium]
SAVTPQAVVATPVARATSTPSPTPISTPISTPVPTSAAAAAPANQPIIVPSATSPAAPSTAAATPTSAPTPTRQPTPESGLYVIIPTEYGVFARTSTSTESESITLLPNETLYEAVGRTEDDTWIQVLLPSGQQAWVFTGVIAIEPEQLSQLPILPFESLPAATPTPAVTPVAAPIATPITPEQASDTVISDDVTPDGVRYVVQPGDYLALIAQEYYGDQFLWQRIYDANQAVIGPDPGVVEVGMELIIPPAP